MIIAISGMGIFLILCLIYLVWFVKHNLAPTLWLVAVALLALDWYIEGRISIPYIAASAVSAAAAIAVQYANRPKPMTADRLFSICASNVEIATPQDHKLLADICEATILSPNFHDYWNATDFNPGKRTSRAQCERIREFGYTGKIPKNMRAASALIEILKIEKQYNLERRCYGGSTTKGV